MIIDDNIYDFIPSQIIEVIEKLQDVLKIVKSKKQTISKVARYEKEKLKCPHCYNENIIKNGFSENGIQKYICKDCLKKFNDLTGTVFSKCKLNYEQIEIFLNCFHDKISIRKTAERMNVDKNTVYLLRQKVLDSFKEVRENTELSGEIESDEIYKSINLKGTKPIKMPRISKPRTSNGTATRGINKHKVCIISAIDEKDNMFFEIVGTGQITSEMIKQSLTPKLNNVTKITTDCKSSYESEAKINNWNLKQVKSKGYTDEEGNNLANINSLHSSLSTFLSPFRGVSTKHLQGYLDWFIFDKYLNYSFDEKNQKRILLNNTMKNSTSILTSNMYDNHSGINFAEVYSDYNYTPSPIN